MDGFSINKNNIYVVHNINYHSNPTKPPTKIYLEEYLLEPVVSNTIIKVKPPTKTINLLNTIDLHDCTETFRKELVGVSNIIEVKDKNRFTVAFDNVPLEFKNYYQDTITIKEDDSIRKSVRSSNNIFIDKPVYVMLNITQDVKINDIGNGIKENQLYKVLEVKSTTSSTSAEIKLYSNYELDFTTTDTRNNYIYKDVKVSQFINSKDYVENVYFKKIEIPRDERVISSQIYKYEVKLSNQVIPFEKRLYRHDIIDDYKGTMKKIVDYIYENEAKKIHYEIPENIGVYIDKTSAVFNYKYKNDLYISYDKRNNPVGTFKNTNNLHMCKKVYTGENYKINDNALFNLDSLSEYELYFRNLFKNILGLHDDINYQCDEYFKSGNMLSNLRLPISFNKYVTFSNNYMLYYKDSNLFNKEIDKSLHGKHVVINNTVLDNFLLSEKNSNRNNTNIYRDFLKSFVYKHKIGSKGFEYDDAKKICSRIYTIYDKACEKAVYKQQDEDYNLEIYKNNKERDKCFEIVYNDDKQLNNEQFIAKMKGFDPTQDITKDKDMTNTNKFYNKITYIYYLMNVPTASSYSTNTIKFDIYIEGEDSNSNTINSLNNTSSIRFTNMPLGTEIKSSILYDITKENTVASKSPLYTNPMKISSSSNSIKLSNDNIGKFKLNQLLQTTSIYKIYVDNDTTERKIYKYPHDNASPTALGHQTLSCYRINGAITDLDNKHGKCVIFEEPTSKFTINNPNGDTSITLSSTDYTTNFGKSVPQTNKTNVHYITEKTDDVGGTEEIYRVTATPDSNRDVTIVIHSCDTTTTTWKSNTPHTTTLNDVKLLKKPFGTKYNKIYKIKLISKDNTGICFSIVDNNTNQTIFTSTDLSDNTSKYKKVGEIATGKGWLGGDDVLNNDTTVYYNFNMYHIDDSNLYETIEDITVNIPSSSTNILEFKKGNSNLQNGDMVRITQHSPKQSFNIS